MHTTSLHACAAAALLTAAVLGAADAATRPFAMGFTPFAPDTTVEAVAANDAAIAADGDLIAHHFDNGVPWTEALAGTPYSGDLMRDWERRARLSKGKKVFLALTPLDGDRKGLAKYRGEKENMALPAPFAGKPLDDPAVKKAYLAYCRKAIEYFKPDWCAIGIEVNELVLNTPQAWPAFVSLYDATLAELRKTSPGLPLCATVTLHALVDPQKKDRNGQREKIKPFLERGDVAALSFHPFMAGIVDDAEAPLAWIKTFTTKPIAIAETTFLAETLTLETFKLTLPGDPARQRRYYETLLAHATRDKYLFVVSFLYRDYDALWEKIKPVVPEFFKAWRDCGLLDGNGAPRPALEVWRTYLRMPLGAAR